MGRSMIGFARDPAFDAPDGEAEDVAQVRENGVRGIVVFEKVTAAGVKVVGRLPLGFLRSDAGGLPNEMDDARGGDVPRRPAFFACVQAEIDVVEIGVEAFV